MKICPMDKDFILFRCIHFGPLSPSNIRKVRVKIPGLAKEQFDRNEKFLARLIDAYGSCAMLAKQDGYVVGHARFYPQVICDEAPLCCQQPEYAPTQQRIEMHLPTIENPADRILRIDCFLVHKDYRGRGLSHALLDGVLEWAKGHDWKTVRAMAAPDNYWLASQICAPMLSTYIKHGFQKVKTVFSSEAEELFRRIRDGESGIEKKEEFERFCAGKDLSELAFYYEVEQQL